MASTGAIFYNAVHGMDREQMMTYISKYAGDGELKALLIKFDELRKGCVLYDEMNAALDEIVNHLKENPIKSEDALDLKVVNLKKLEGRIKMLILSQHIAKHLNDKNKIYTNARRVTELFRQYRIEGGSSGFQSPH